MLRRRGTRPRRAGHLSALPADGGGAARPQCARPRWRAGIWSRPAAGPTRRSSTTTGWFLSEALTTRARVAIAQGEPEQAERDAHDALACAAEVEAYLFIPDILECLGTLAGDAGSHREAARLFGAAHGIRQRMGAVRFKV